MTRYVTILSCVPLFFQMCLGYARFIITKMPSLKYLDNREIMLTGRPEEPYEPHPDDMHSTFFFFTVLRIMSAPFPPRVDKVINVHISPIYIHKISLKSKQTLYNRGISLTIG